MKQAAGPRSAGDYAIEIIRSRRRTVALQIRPDLSVVLRVPQRMTRRELDRFLDERRDWIEKHRAIVAQRLRDDPPGEPLSEEELRALAERAKAVIPERVRRYAPLVGVDYGRITIRCQRTRWGSCSSRGNLNFNCLLLLTPPEVLDSVVVHELCHRLEMNHSPRFYAEVLRVFPEYRKWDGWLKAHGASILRRLDREI